jgi:hypothetical protein
MAPVRYGLNPTASTLSLTQPRPIFIIWGAAPGGMTY